MFFGYREYLRSDEFKEIKEIVFKRSDNKCELCGDTAKDPHHLRYPNWSKVDRDQAPYNYILALCHKCHCLFHAKEESERKLLNENFGD